MPRRPHHLICALVAALLASLAGVQAPAAWAQTSGGAGFCQPGQTPQFVFGFATLKQVVGAPMGDPTECEHPNSDNGDTLQHTTTGLAFYRQSTNTPTFTDGFQHWALVPGAIVYWTGSAIDPPGLALPAPRLDCHDLGGGACLRAEAALGEPIRLLNTTSAGRPLLRQAAGAGVTARTANLPPGTLGNFDPSTGEVLVSSQLAGGPAIDVAPVLAHELQHAADALAAGPAIETTSGCFATEANAFRTEASVWTELQGGRLKPPTSPIEEELNAIATVIRTDPAGFVAKLTAAYRHECAT